MTFLAALIFAVIGIIEIRIYRTTKADCTAATEGAVVFEGNSRQRNLDPVESRYLTSKKAWRQIEIETESAFRHKRLYADASVGQKGDRVIIHFDPDDPDTYYLNDGVNHYRTTAVIGFAAGGLMLCLTVFLIYLIVRPPKKEPNTKRRQAHPGKGQRNRT